MQFRTRDFDMERCVLTLEVPKDTASLVASAHVHSGSKLDVWMLDNTLEIHPAIFWGKAPKRTGLFTTFDVTGDTKLESKPFRCPSTSFTTLEFECVGRDKNCHVDFWQDREKPYAGAYITFLKLFVS
jgi:hypothetical protein